MTKEEAINKAIGHLIGKIVTPGTIIGTNSDPIAYKFLRYDGDNAVCTDGKNEKTFLAAEIFDVNKIKNIAMHYLNLGFWTEGMESIAFDIYPK